MNTAVYNITDFAPNYYNVHILTNGIYCGVGRFCETQEEMIRFCNEYNVTEIKRIGG